MAAAIAAIAEWAGSEPVFSQTARRRAAEAFVDTVGCLVAGAEEESVQAVRRASTESIGTHSAASVIGGGAAPVPVAALVNATAAHALDFDDNFFAASTHASAVLVPALLATAQAQGSSGAELINAYLVGLQAQAAVARGVNPSHYVAGWHATSTIGCIGAAAGVASLQRLDAARIAGAMSLAVSMASGLKTQHGTSAKALHAGLAARNATDAAAWSANGMTGRMDILEMPYGFQALYHGEGGPGWHDVSRFLGESHSIESTGLAPKRHPCCGSAHPSIDAALDLKADADFAVEQIASITVTVDLASARNLCYDAPTSGIQGRFSLQYCLALALTRERLELDDFAARFMLDGQVRRLMPLTRVVVAEADSKLSIIGSLPHSVELELDDGRVLRASRQYAKGTVADPFSDADRREKFLGCCSSLPAYEDPNTLLDALLYLEDQDTLAFLAPVFDARPRDAERDS